MLGKGVFQTVAHNNACARKSPTILDTSNYNTSFVCSRNPFLSDVTNG